MNIFSVTRINVFGIRYEQRLIGRGAVFGAETTASATTMTRDGSGTSIVMLGASQDAFIHYPTWIMGIDKSLTDEFPSVMINGTKYHYGKETTYGQYLVENAKYAKDYWVFRTADELREFLVCLPESAKRLLDVYPQWVNGTDEEREMLRMERKELLRALYKKRKDKPGPCYNVLTFDESTWFSVYTSGINNRQLYQDLDVVITEHEVEKGGRVEFVIELRPKPFCCEEPNPPLTIAKDQALKLAAVLLNAARCIELKEESVDEE